MSIKESHSPFSSKNLVVVGMSGGVDSSVSALLLKEQGYEVIGLFMKNWEEKDDQGHCRAAEDYDDVRKVCDQIDIPCYGINFVEEYRTQVFSQFIEDFKQGLTPNPDILCNREIKFKVFLQKALSLGGKFLATGHYCQNLHVSNQFQLTKGKDSSKDQTYFLYTVNQSILKHVLFPVGHLEKKQVREIAHQHQLATSSKKDSTGICFIGERNFRLFLSQYIESQKGAFETLQGKCVGYHQGTAYYTLGQRKGLGIGGEGEAWFVVGKDINRNVVLVAQGADHQALYCDDLVANNLSFIGDAPSSFPFVCRAKVRYRQEDQICMIDKIVNGQAFVSFPSPQRAVTPGQSIVFYEGNTCLGGGIIQKPGLSHYIKNR